ncbi:hypothetical protein Hanom_Chr02g00151241 [Helianthus anomalus]
MKEDEDDSYSEGSVVPDSYDGRGDDHVEEVVLSCLAMIMVMGLRIMKPVTVPRTDKKNMAIIFSLLVPRA